MSKALTAGVSAVAGLIILSGAGLAAGASDGQPVVLTPSTEVVFDDLTVPNEPIEAVTTEPPIAEPSPTDSLPADPAPPPTVAPTSTEPAPTTTAPPPSTEPAPTTPPVISVPRPVPCADCAPCATSPSGPVTGFREPRPQSKLTADKADEITIDLVVTTNGRKDPTLDETKSKNLDWVSTVGVYATPPCLTGSFTTAAFSDCRATVTGVDGATVKLKKGEPTNGRTTWSFQINPLSANKTYTIKVVCTKS